MSRNRQGVIAVLVGLVVATGVVAGCSTDNSQPVPPGQEYIDTPIGGWDAGLWTVCNHGNRVYAANASGAALAVVPGDPSCR